MGWEAAWNTSIGFLLFPCIYLCGQAFNLLLSIVLFWKGWRHGRREVGAGNASPPFFLLFHLLSLSLSSSSSSLSPCLIPAEDRALHTYQINTLLVISLPSLMNQLWVEFRLFRDTLEIKCTRREREGYRIRQGKKLMRSESMGSLSFSGSSEVGLPLKAPCRASWVTSSHQPTSLVGNSINCTQSRRREN